MNRRKWIHNLGLAGAAALVGGSSSVGAHQAKFSRRHQAVSTIPVPPIANTLRPANMSRITRLSTMTAGGTFTASAAQPAMPCLYRVRGNRLLVHQQRSRELGIPRSCSARFPAEEYF